MKKSHYIAVAAAALLISSTAWAGVLTIPNTFTAGTPAVAADVNANFTAAKAAVDDNNTRITANTASAATNATNITANASAITTLQNAVLVRTINVSPVIGGGGVIDPVASGTALINAVAAITGSSVTNQFTVKLEPGIYDLGTRMLQLADGVNLEGSGQGVTIVTALLAGTNSVTNWQATVKTLGSNVIRDITLKNTDLSGMNFPSAALTATSGSILIERSELTAEIPLMFTDPGILTIEIWSSRIFSVISDRPAFSWTGTKTLVIRNSEFGISGVPIAGFGVSHCVSTYVSDTFAARAPGC